MKYFKQLNKILSFRQKKAFISLTLLMFLSVFLEVLTLNSIFLLLSFFADPSSIENNKIILFFREINSSNLTYSKLLIIFFTVFLSKTFISIFIVLREHTFVNNTRAEISNEFFRGYIYMPRIFHIRTNISETTKNITSEIDVLISALLSISIITLETLVLIGLVLFLLFINFKITLLSFFCLLFFSFLLSYLNTKKLLSMGKERVKLIQLRLKNIIEGISGAKIYALTGSQEKLVNDFKITNAKLAKNNINSGFRNAIPRPLFELFILLIVVIFLIFFFNENDSFKDLIPTLGVFLTAAYRLVPSFSRILSNIQKFHYNIAAAEKLSIDKEKFLSIKNEDEITTSLNFHQEINVKNVSYSYNKNLKDEKNFILKNLNLKIKSNSKIGIIGDSGTGKSTLLDLLMGISSPQEGKIFIDNKDLSKCKKSWYKIIGCVPQEVFILDESLKKNIAFGLSDDLIDMNKVNRALELANLTELTKNLKHGVENLVGEKGSRLSGGQRQRIGIARALYNEPSILFFDEATNALDVETEKNIVNEIFNNKINRTIIFVSHNRENLKYCDIIYEVKDKVIKKL
jgi:ATP-binding cassette, subfamily B, bacterial PglK